MKHRLIFLILASTIAFSATAQNFPVHSVSLRLGMPAGLTYKTYVTKKAALEFGIGTGSRYWLKQYYINSFNSFPKYEDFKYIDHQVQSTFYLQGRYIKDFPIATTGMEGSLNWYCGVGGVLKVAKMKYRYTDTDANPPTQIESRTDFDFGPEIIAGGEYYLEDTPFSFYGEASVMLEVFDRVSGRVFGAVGVRFHFID